MNTEEVLHDLANSLVVLRRQESVVLTIIAQLDRDGYSVPFGSAAKMVADVGRVGLAESRRLTERSLALHGTVGLSGAPIAPTLPNAAAAYADGEISGEHIDRIRGLTEELPAEVLAGESWPVAEECLVAIARDVGPRGLTRPIRELHARLDPDGREPREDEPAEPRRELRLRQRRNRFDIDGYLDIETGLQLQALLDALGKPVLLCGWHHRLLHHAGWAVRMEDGLPRFTPPGYRRIAA